MRTTFTCTVSCALLWALTLPGLTATASIPHPVDAAAATAPTSQPADHFDAVGTLTLSVAIGGETTGLILHTDHGNFQLSCFGELRRQAEALVGKSVHIVGTLTQIPGTELPTRTVVAVESLSPVDQPVRLEYRL